MAASSSEESLASLCREAEQLKVKIDEEKQKVNDLQRKFHYIDGRTSSIFFLTKKSTFSLENACLKIVFGDLVDMRYLESMVFCTILFLLLHSTDGRA